MYNYLNKTIAILQMQRDRLQISLDNNWIGYRSEFNCFSQKTLDNLKILSRGKFGFNATCPADLLADLMISLYMCKPDIVKAGPIDLIDSLSIVIDSMNKLVSYLPKCNPDDFDLRKIHMHIDKLVMPLISEVNA